jgi:hypothetical protein
MKFIAHLHAVRKDQDGEVKLTLCIPSTQAQEVMGIPADQNLVVSIEEEN